MRGYGLRGIFFKSLTLHGSAIFDSGEALVAGWMNDEVVNQHDMDKDDRLRTAAEISAKLTWQGNIRHPMTLQQLGRLLSAEGITQSRCGAN